MKTDEQWVKLWPLYSESGKTELIRAIRIETMRHCAEIADEAEPDYDDRDYDDYDMKRDIVNAILSAASALEKQK